MHKNGSTESVIICKESVSDRSHSLIIEFTLIRHCYSVASYESRTLPIYEQIFKNFQNELGARINLVLLQSHDISSFVFSFFVTLGNDEIIDESRVKNAIKC